MDHPSSTRAADLLLGPDKDQRVRVTKVLMVLVLDLVLFSIGAFGVKVGLLDGLPVLVWAVVTLAFLATFYATIRSGLNLRLFPDDPALTMPQGFVSVCTIVGCYVICAPVRGAILLTLALTLMFGMFALSPKQVRALSVFAVVLLGSAMVLGNRLWPDRFPMRQEAMHFLLVAVLLPSIAYLAGQLSQLRHRLTQRTHDLAQALEQNRQLAIRDELTGLYNRRHMHELMDADSKRAARSGRPSSVVLIDLDHFKRVNDTFGHACGDAVLQGFARCARESLRETDVLGRWGGEEFVMLFPETSANEAVAVVDRVRRALSEVAFDGADASMRITFSAGVSACLPGEAWAATVDRADRAMYAAKHGGRNRSVVG